jgi:hypothetical protein
VFITQNTDVAAILSSLNGGQRIDPLPQPQSYSGEKTSPTWNGMKWSRSLLVDAVRYEFPGRFPRSQDFDKVDELIVDGMTPLQAMQEALLFLRAPKTPGSPKTVAGGFSDVNDFCAPLRSVEKYDVETDMCPNP